MSNTNQSRCKVHLLVLPAAVPFGHFSRVRRLDGADKVGMRPGKENSVTADPCKDPPLPVPVGSRFLLLSPCFLLVQNNSPRNQHKPSAHLLFPQYPQPKLINPQKPQYQHHNPLSAFPRLTKIEKINKNSERRPAGTGIFGGSRPGVTKCHSSISWTSIRSRLGVLLSDCCLSLEAFK